MSFKIESEKQSRMSFLDVQIIREDKIFTTSVYSKLTFSGVYTHFVNSLPSTYKSGTVYRHSYRSLQICSRWTKLHYELVCLEETFLKIGYPKDFLDKCFKNL